MDSDRLSSLEQGIAELQAAQNVTRLQFEQFLATLSAIPLPKTEPPEATPSKTRATRPSVPPEFDGDRSKGVAFLNSCQTYIRLCPKEFPDEQTKIVWAMSYMKSGRAQKWTARIFRWEEQPENEYQTKFLDWDDFRSEFRKEFTPAHADAVAINRLESSAYYQRNRPLDDYLDEFQDLITESGYTDPKTVVVKFRRGLNAQIQNVVATMTSGRPSDSNPEQWYKAARTVDENRAANEAFSSAFRSPAPAPRVLGTSVARAPPSVKVGHTHGTPTELDAPRKKASEQLCFRCKLPGHFTRDCPTRYDVREMTIAELEEELQIRLSELDVASGPSDPETAPAELAKDGDF